MDSIHGGTAIPRVLTSSHSILYPNLNDYVSSPKISGHILEWRWLRYHEQLLSYSIFVLTLVSTDFSYLSTLFFNNYSWKKLVTNSIKICLLNDNQWIDNWNKRKRSTKLVGLRTTERFRYNGPSYRIGEIFVLEGPAPFVAML